MSSKLCEKCFKSPAYILSPLSCNHKHCLTCPSLPNCCAVCDTPYTGISMYQWQSLGFSVPEVCNLCNKSTFSVMYFVDCKHISCASCANRASGHLFCKACNKPTSRVAIRNMNVNIINQH